MERLSDFREEITEIDRKLIELLARRCEISREVAEYKKSESIPMMQSAQVEHVLESAEKLAQQKNMRADFARTLFKMIIDESCRIQSEIIEVQEN